MNETLMKQYIELENSRKELNKSVNELEKQLAPIKAAILAAIPQGSDQLLVNRFLATIKRIEVESIVAKQDAIEKHGYQWLQVNGLLKTRTDLRLSVCEVNTATLKVGA